MEVTPEQHSQQLLNVIEFKKNIKNPYHIHKILLLFKKMGFQFQKGLSFFLRWLVILHHLNRLYTFLFFKKIKHTQPLYNFAILKNEQFQRACIHRADKIYEIIQPWGQGGHILDIGCNLGFYSHYFAERGYLVDAMDPNPDHIKICCLLQKLNKKKRKIKFSVAEFSEDFVKSIPSNQYDITFLLDLTLSNNGVESIQRLLNHLMEKTRILFLELSNNEDNHFFQQHKHYFSQCSDMTIKRIGFFQHSNDPVRRPLYMVTKKSMQFCGNMYPVFSRKFIDGRYYYDCGDKYIKKYMLNESRRNDLNRIVHEIKNFQSLPDNIFFPKLFAHEQTENTVELLFNKIPGENLHELILREQKIPTLFIFNQIIKALSFLFSQGLYHNDIRLWNVMYDGNQVYLLDLEWADVNESENSKIALLWLIYQLHDFNYYHFQYPIKELPPLDFNKLDAPFQKIAFELQNSYDFSHFLKWHEKFMMQSSEIINQA